MGADDAHRVNVPNLSASKYSRVSLLPANVAFEIVPGGAFSVISWNVNTSPSQWVRSKVSPRGPSVSASLPSRSLTVAGPQ